MRVLVVEDARPLADVVAEGLQDQGITDVDVARDGLEAAAKLEVNVYDVVVLDRDLPGVHGDTLCQMITERDGRAMVLMLTAAGSPGSRVSEFSLGADNYLAKPFHFSELVLRVRRAGPASAGRPGSHIARGRGRARPGTAHRHPGRAAASPCQQRVRRAGGAAPGQPRIPAR